MPCLMTPLYIADGGGFETTHLPKQNHEQSYEFSYLLRF